MKIVIPEMSLVSMDRLVEFLSDQPQVEDFWYYLAESELNRGLTHELILVSAKVFRSFALDALQNAESPVRLRKAVKSWLDAVEALPNGACIVLTY